MEKCLVNEKTACYLKNHGSKMNVCIHFDTFSYRIKIWTSNLTGLNCVTVSLKKYKQFVCTSTTFEMKKKLNELVPSEYIAIT